MLCKNCGNEFMPGDEKSGNLCPDCYYKLYPKIKSALEKVDQEAIKKKIREKEDGGPIQDEVINMEQVILKGMLTDLFILDRSMLMGMNRMMFSTKEGAILFEEIEDLYTSKFKEKIIQPDFFSSKIKEREDFSKGVQAFYNETNERNSPRFSRIMVYIDVLKDRLARDELSRSAESINEYLRGEGKNRNLKIVEFISNILKDLRELQRQRVKKDIQKIKGELLVIAREVETRKKTGELKIIGYDIGDFTCLAQALSGLRKGFLYGIAGAPRRGKTTLTLEIATRIATFNKIPVLFYTWEQTRKNLTYRLLAKEARINADTLQRKQLDKDPQLEKNFILGWRKMEKYMEYFYLIEGSKDDTIERIKAHAYNAMQDFDTDDVMIVVDYIQKMPLGQEYSSEKFRVEEISTRIKGLSLELNCPILAISSLSKEGCNLDLQQSDERPSMYHCKGSGDIEYDLDAAIIMAKDWEDTKELTEQLRQIATQMDKDPNKLPKLDIVNLHLDKNRDSPEGLSSIIQMLFIIEANKFVELGFKVENDMYRFRNVNKIVQELIKEGYVEFQDASIVRNQDPNAVKIGLKQ
ncbi:MAG: DnaB-like helicase C-terminal domain-containing protein [Candidatus Wallbacteria bacterium]|nr:DnaB-like helicase C-terminal domain-containing protein [Candidatus Wallbacteria bacterium]